MLAFKPNHLTFLNKPRSRYKKKSVNSWVKLGRQLEVYKRIKGTIPGVAHIAYSKC